jgi:hypothetical protein
MSSSEWPNKVLQKSFNSESWFAKPSRDFNVYPRLSRASFVILSADLSSKLFYYLLSATSFPTRTRERICNTTTLCSLSKAKR